MRAIDKRAAVIIELDLQIDAVADADDARGRVATQDVGRKRYRGHQRFKRPRRRSNN